MSRVKQPRTVRLSTVLWVVLAVVLVAAWVALTNWRSAPGDGGGPAPVATSSPAAGDPATDTEDVVATAAEAAATRWADALGAPPEWPADLADPDDCAASEAALVGLCRAVDAEPPFAGAGVAGGSCAVLRESLEAVARRSPHVSGELRSLGALLDNVFHLFRVVGRERLALLRGTVVGRPELAEPAAMATWRWAASRERCARSGATDLDADAIYEQAAFALETVGGQAYLRRRSPRVEGLATFYAVLAVDRADRAGRNALGVDLRPAIARARGLVAGQDLVFRERYLATLDDIGRRWAARGDGGGAAGRPGAR